MARQKPARPVATKARKKAASKAAARKSVKQSVRRAMKKGAKAVRTGARVVRKATRKGAAVQAAATKRARKIVKTATRSASGVKAAATKKAKTLVKTARQSAAGVKAAVTRKVNQTGANARALKAGVTAALTPPKAKVVTAKTPNLDRPRKTVADIRGVPSSWTSTGAASAARTGRAELRERLLKNTNTSPALTAGDVDADWQSAESSGNEAPGGDNQTPDQDVVDEIGRALGVEYADDEELQGGEEIAERDRHRWELDPSSKDDFDDKE